MKPSSNYLSVNKRIFGALILMVVVSALSACGGSGGGSSDGGTSGGTTGGTSGGTTSGTTGGISSLTACQMQFSPELAAAGVDCTPVYNQYCPGIPQPQLPLNEPNVYACDGVAITKGTVTNNGASTDYVSVSPADANGNPDPLKGKSALYILVPGTAETGTTAINQLRMSELAKGRDLTVVSPNAPGGPVFGEEPSWGNGVLDTNNISIADRIALMDALIKTLQGTGTPLFSKVILAGVSGGAEFTFLFTCAHPEELFGALIVAAPVTKSDYTGCSLIPAAASASSVSATQVSTNATTAVAQPVVTEQIHGTSDLDAPYNGPLNEPVPTVFQGLYSNNGCAASDLHSVTLPEDKNPAISGIVVQWVKPCSSQKGSSLVTVDGGGHGWPGYDGPIGLSINIFGPVTLSFDATLQGYDLLLYLATAGSPPAAPTP